MCPSTATLWNSLWLHRRQSSGKKMFNTFKLPAAVLLASTLVNPVHANAEADATATGNWITSWFASPQPIWGADFVLPTNIPDSLHQQTVREIVKISAGGRRVRVVLSNRYGTQPLVIGEVHVAFSSDGAAIVKDSDRVLTFAG